MERIRDVFNKVSVSSVWQLKRYSDCIIPRAVETVQGVTEEVEEIASIEAAAVDVVELDQNFRAAEM